MAAVCTRRLDMNESLWDVLETMRGAVVRVGDVCARGLVDRRVAVAANAAATGFGLAHRDE